MAIRFKWTLITNWVFSSRRIIELSSKQCTGFLRPVSGRSRIRANKWPWVLLFECRPLEFEELHLIALTTACWLIFQLFHRSWKFDAVNCKSDFPDSVHNYRCNVQWSLNNFLQIALPSSSQYHQVISPMFKSRKKEQKQFLKQGVKHMLDLSKGHFVLLSTNKLYVLFAVSPDFPIGKPEFCLHMYTEN